jgi:hypothetical protein
MTRLQSKLANVAVGVGRLGRARPCPLSGQPDIGPTSPNERAWTHNGRACRDALNHKRGVTPEDLASIQRVAAALDEFKRDFRLADTARAGLTRRS